MHLKTAFSDDTVHTMPRRELHEWYLKHQRALPWRENPRPYETWLCEVIMQQTRIDQGTAYWQKFVNRWPDFRSLANASVDDVLKEWQGLGYYSRARNLHKTAQIIHTDFPNSHPTALTDWLSKPGIGPYTAAAICSICFDTPVAAIDGNVLRVLSRYLGIHEPIDRPAGRKPLEEFANTWVDQENPGRHNQAIMELGALTCTPHAPDCANCPLQNACVSQKMSHETKDMPPFKQGKTKVLDVALNFHVIIHNNSVLMHKRPDIGVWGGLWAFPSSEHPFQNQAEPFDVPEAPEKHLIPRGLSGTPVKHLLSHRRLHVQFWLWESPLKNSSDLGDWKTWEEAEALALPRVLERSWEDVKKSAAQNASKTTA